jgi:ABC-type transporter Mla subunit MlaD
MPVIGRLFYEIGGDTDRLQADLRKAVDMAKTAGLDVKRAGQSFLASFNEALNPTGLLTEKLRLLEAAGKSSGEIMAVMGSQIKAAAETAKANSQAIDPLVQKYADLANAAKSGGFSIESFGKTLTDFARNPMSSAKEGIAGFAEKLGPAAAGLAGIASAAIAAGAAIFKLAESTADEAEQITNLSLRTGIGVERVQSLQKAAELMGVSGETVVSAVSKINLELGKFGTGGEFTKGITSLGISLEDASGKAKPAVELLSELRTKLLDIEDPSERAQVATAVLGRRNQELVPLLVSAKENLFDLAKQLEDTGAVMDKVAIDQAMKLDEKLDLLSARFAKVKTVAKEAAVGTALAVSDLFTGDFWKLLTENLAKGAGMQSVQLASLQMRIKEAADAAVEAAKKTEEAGQKAADAAGLAKMKEEDLYNERLKLLSQGRENVDLLLKLQEAQEKLNTAIEKGLSHKEKEAALNAVLSIRDQIKAREDEARAYEKALDAVQRMQRERYEEAEKLKQKEAEEEKKRLEDQQAFSAKLQAEINKAAAGLEKIKPESPLKDLIPTEKDIHEMESRSAEFSRIAAGWGKEAISIGKEMREQISTVVNDFGKKVAESIVHWKGLGNAVKEFFTSLAESTLRVVVERLFQPLQSSVEKVVDSIFEKLFNPGSDKASTSNLTPESGSWGNLLGTAENGLSDWLKSATTPAEAGPSISGILAAGNPLLQIYRPIQYSPAQSPGFVGPTLDMLKGGTTGGIFGVGGTAGALIQGGLMAGGTTAFLDSFRQNGVRGWVEAIGGGAAIGAAIGSVVPVIGTGIGAAFGAVGGAISKGFQSLVGLFTGKNAYQAGAKELSRDFGGITMSADDLEKYLNSIGISESQAYPIRKDIESSSRFLVEVSGPLAAAQGKTQEFLKSLEAVKTAWGTFDFRKQYELGELTGDWTELDEAFKAAFKDSQALNKNVPDWQSKLLMLGDQTKQTASEFQNLYKQFEETKTVSDEFAEFLKKNADALDEATKSSSAFADELAAARKALEIKPLLDGLKNLRDGISGMVPAVDTIYDRFLKTGDITDAFAAKITELGGDISKFTEVSGLVKLNSYFGEIEILFAQGLDDRVDGLVVQQNRAEDSAFGFQAARKRFVETDITRHENTGWKKQEPGTGNGSALPGHGRDPSGSSQLVRAVRRRSFGAR